MCARMRRLAIGLVLSAACTTSSSEPPPPPPPPPPGGTTLQMNDLSVLFPMATTPAELALYLTPGSPSANGPLLPQALYMSDPGAIDFPDLHVVGFRLDPCFGHMGPITDPSSCDNQIRLIWQPLFGDAANAPQAEDAGVHVLYKLTRDQLLAAVKEIAAARAAADDTDLGPLAVNPIVVREGLAGEMAQKLMAIASKYADGTKIERITTFELEASGGLMSNGGSDGPGSNGPVIDPSLFWQMHGVTVAEGVETPIDIPTVGDGTLSVSITASTNPLEASLVPETTSADDPDLLGATQQAMSSTAMQRQAAFDAALRIENPNKNTPDTIDCASCHMAEPVRVLDGQQMFGMTTTGDANAFVADPSIPAADLAATTTMIVSPPDGGLNIHAFSYRNTTPMINQRVINETAAILAYLQPLVASK